MIRAAMRVGGLSMAAAVALLLQCPLAGATSLPVRTFDVAALGLPQASVNAAAADPALSADGSVAAFDTPSGEVYTVDLLTGARTLVSAAPDGTPANGVSSEPSLSADGSVVAFTSTATNLVPGATSGAANIYVRISGGPPQLISGAQGGGPANGVAGEPDVAANGLSVAFASTSSNLVANDTNGVTDIFVADLVDGSITRVSVTNTGGEANGDSSHPSIDGDGGVVTFDSVATNLVPGIRPAVEHVFVRDRINGTTSEVTVSSAGREQNTAVPPPFDQISSISADGRFIVFDSNASNLVHGDINRHSDIFLRDRVRHTTTLVSENNAGFEGNNDSFDPMISPDGQVVAFESFSTNLGSGGGPRENVFVRDLPLGTTSVIDVGPTGRAPQREIVSELLQRPVVANHGYIAAFESTAPNLVGGRDGQTHVFVRLMYPPSGAFWRPPPRRTRSHRVQVTLGADDPRAKLFLCQIDRGTPFTCKAGRVTLPRVGRGRHVLTARAGGPGMLYDPLALRATFRVT
jgi:Tol biopolymer transport system component